MKLDRMAAQSKLGGQMTARFNAHDFCIEEGVATYHRKIKLRQRWCRHSWGLVRPKTDYSPQAYTRCRKCGLCFKWFFVGTHRYGSIATPENVEEL